MIDALIVLVSFCWNFDKNNIFLILSNVKISGPLERVKMKRGELFSNFGASTRVFWRLCGMWNSVSFWNGSFTFIYFHWRVSEFSAHCRHISGALSSYFQRTVNFSTAHCKFSHGALEIWRQCAENKKTLVCGVKSGGDPDDLLRSL